ncbi:hypothetical protein IMSAG025_02420 [Muribaculaceae bacterium]|nr:hypothetical protein IMSAG025_02420 [Muribaculaceae bacterium]
MRGFLVADLQCVGRNHTVETDLSGQTVELVAVGVVGSVHVHVVFGDLFSIRRHIVIGVFGCLVFCKGGGCHADNGNG